ncbi:DUF4012 domain-containing protein [Patescibacteria group bacterium]|nr:MAG: DUF4012 domain-containing protein [Patescibacteria group bacterium]
MDGLTKNNRNQNKVDGSFGDRVSVRRVSEKEVENFYQSQAEELSRVSKVATEPEVDGEAGQFRLRKFLFPSEIYLRLSPIKKLVPFLLLGLLLMGSVWGFALVGRGMFIKGKVMNASYEALENLNRALSALQAGNFVVSSNDLTAASDRFAAASAELDSMGKFFIFTSKYIPFVSQLSTGKHAVEIGKHVSAAGAHLVAAAGEISRLQEGEGKASLLELFQAVEGELRQAQTELTAANEHVDNVNIDDIPEAQRSKFMEVKDKLPIITAGVDSFLNNSHIFVDLLGGNGPRKYLFLFQNNQEMRATGGFIGSYGLLDISDGHVRNFFIDGIFNPDGQLKDWIVPPRPIQKISTNWSLHDSNWFPDFPMSAKEAIVFYEKTGGPTVDGVITVTPTVMERLLKITGPIEMSAYGVTLTADNFVAETQQEIEVDYDKQRNQPKKILSDLAPLVFDRLLSSRDLKTALGAANALVQALNEKHILLFAYQNNQLQQLISTQGWSGEVRATPRDYLSVVNTNINGFKTDGVIEESIDHVAEIQEDGSIIDTVTVTRHHTGGQTPYDWWNRVNPDYLRVYVPQGSKLLTAEGYTREANEPRVDYAALGFKRDPWVEREEQNMTIDKTTGTRIYDDAGKTVFANWAYVSPQETVEIRYSYLLPFRIAVTEDAEKLAGSYSLLAQKQSGSLGSRFTTKLSYPSSLKSVWVSSDQLQVTENALQWETDMAVDRFWGTTFVARPVILNQ